MVDSGITCFANAVPPQTAYRFFLKVLREVDDGKEPKEDKKRSREQGSGDRTPLVE